MMTGTDLVRLLTLDDREYLVYPTLPIDVGIIARCASIVDAVTGKWLDSEEAVRARRGSGSGADRP